MQSLVLREATTIPPYYQWLWYNGVMSHGTCVRLPMGVPIPAILL
jgi:hypothetical protein